MKLQTRVRQMLQWHFSFSKLAAFCVFNHFLHWLLPVLQCQEYWDKSFHDPKENLLRTGCLGAQRAKQTCPVWGQMATTLLLTWGKPSSSVEAVWMKSLTAFWRAHSQPAVSVWGLPARLPFRPAAGFLRCTSNVLACFLYGSCLHYGQSRFGAPRASQFNRGKWEARLRAKLWQ